MAVDAVFRAPVAYNGISVLMAVIGYSLQIYCDFSGYSDMAIGIAKIWDFDLGRNFNMPYIAMNPSDFWRRWHISLSTWFRDYVYIPLGGNRKSNFRTYFNLFITMVLSGIWHGASITFFIWGIVHGLGSAIHKGVRDLAKRYDVSITFPKFVSIFMNYTFVSLAWIIFRAKDLALAQSVFTSILNCSGLMYINVYVIVYVLLFSMINFLALINAFAINLDLDCFNNKIIIAIWIWLIVLFMYCGNSTFIYAQF